MRITLHSIFAATYVLICLLDFVGMPLFYAWMNAQQSADHLIMLALSVKDNTQLVPVLTVLRQQSVWTPLTLQSGGLFHLAYCSLLGVSIWRKGSPDQQN